MAGARDLKHQDIRLHRRQQEINVQAAIEAEQRRSEAEERAGLTPSERRRRDNIRRKQLRPVYENKMGPGPSENKATGAAPGVTFLGAQLDRVPFATETAREVAIEAGLTMVEFVGRVPTGSGNTFKTADVRKLIADKERAAAEAAEAAEAATAGNGPQTAGEVEGGAEGAGDADRGATAQGEAADAANGADAAGPDDGDAETVADGGVAGEAGGAGGAEEGATGDEPDPKE